MGDAGLCTQRQLNDVHRMMDDDLMILSRSRTSRTSKQVIRPLRLERQKQAQPWPRASGAYNRTPKDPLYD